MTIGPENLGNGSTTAQDRFAGGMGAYRQVRRDTGLGGETAVDGEVATRNGSMPALDTSGVLDRTPTLPSLDLGGLSEPVFPRTGWLDNGHPPASLAEHPLLRGLLLELPPKGAVPSAGWLDRWFEAARSILELLYAQESDRSR